MQTMPVMLNVEKPDIRGYKDAMNSSYITSYLPQVENNNTRNFAEEFQKISGEDRATFNAKTNGENNPFSLENKKEQEYANYTRNDRNASDRTDRTDRESPRGLKEENILERGPRENESNKNPKENEKTGQNNTGDKKEALEKNPKQPQQTETGEKQVKEHNGNDNRSNIREVIEKAQIQRIEMLKAKEDIKDNFGEAKKIDTAAQAEKIILKVPEVKTGEANPAGDDKGIKNKLVSNAANQLEKNAEIKAGDEKSHESSGSEKKQSQEQHPEKKDTNPIVTADLKTHQNDTHKEPININLLNDLSKNFRQVNDAQVTKTYSQSNLYEQYQLLRDKISGTIENSIKLLISSGESKATIQLHPPELGRLQVELITHENQVTAKINTENVAVKEVILSNLNQLKSNLENAGTQITKFDVEVGGFKNQFEQNFSNGETGGKRRGRGGGYLPAQDSDELKPNEIRNYAALTAYLGRSINCLI